MSGVAREARDRHQQIKDLFEQLCRLPAIERGAFLREACGSDAQLRKELESLLRFSESGPIPRETDAVSSAGGARTNLLGPGELFAGRYRCLLLLGTGASSEVYRAHDLVLGAPVALKLIRGIEPTLHGRLLREVRLARQVSHPAVCRVYDLGEDEGQSFLSMEYIDGESLDALLARMWRIPPEKVVEVARDLCEGLAAAHAAGVLHRDLKPSNVMIDGLGRARITDFGLATTTQLLDADLAGGTVGYMAPEQIAGAPRVSAQTDLFALGLVLYETLTGRPPFDAATPGGLLEQMRGPPPAPPSGRVPGVDPRLDRLILQALSCDPGERPESASVMARALAGELPASLVPGLIGSEPGAFERRMVTAVVVAWSSDAPDPPSLEERRAEFRRHQELASQVVARHGGSVAQLLGEDLLAHFGDPIAHGDDPQRALRAALEIIDGVHQIDTSGSPRLAPRIGIDTGLALVEERWLGIGRQRLVFGDVVDRARAIAEAATPGTAWASEQTFGGAGLPAGSAGDQRSFDSSAGGIPASRVTAQTAVASHRFQQRPLVGRTTELRSLGERWEEARSGLGQLVMISGEAGIGKTRIIRAFAESVAASGAAWLEGRCSAVKAGSPFSLWTDLVRRATGMESPAAPAQQLQALRARLERDGRQELLGRFSRLLALNVESAGAAMDPRSQRAEMITSIVSWIAGLATAGPAVVVCENLQWSDGSSLEVLEALLEASSAAPLLLLVSFRPEWSSAFRGRWSAHSNASTLAVHPIGPAETLELIDAVAPDRPFSPERRSEMARDSDGIPLYAEELALYSLSGGGREEFPAGSPIPPSLHGLLSARLDRVPAAKAVAQLASVLGRDFSLSLLSLASPWDQDELDRGLDLLCGEEILLRRAQGPDQHFRFKHALVQEAAYQSQPERQRLAAHARIARLVLESHEAMTLVEPEIAARHLELAGLEDEAIEWWQRAAAKAVEHWALEEATHHYERALAGAQRHRGARWRSLELKLRLALIAALGEHQGYASDAIDTHSRRASRLARASSDEACLVAIAVARARFEHGRSHRAGSAAALRRLRRLGRRVRDPSLLCMLHQLAGTIEFFRGRHEQAAREHDRALELAKPEGARQPARLVAGDPEAVMLIASSLNQTLLGRLGEARRSVQRSLSRAEASGSPFTLAFLQTSAAAVALMQGDREWAVRLTEEAVRMLTRLRADSYFSPFSVSLLEACALVEGDDPGRAVELLEEGLTRHRSRGFEAFMSFYLWHLARAKQRLGKSVEAREVVRDGLSFTRTRLERFWEPELHRLAGDLARLRDPLAGEAEACYRRALAVARKHGARLLELRAATSLARLWQEHRADRARRLLESVHAHFDEDLDTPDLRSARELLGALGTAPPRR